MVLVGYWPLNEDSGDTAYDHSGNENHGTAFGTPERQISGVLGGYSTNFTNKQDSFSVASSPKLNPDSITVSAWVKYSDLYSDQGAIFRKSDAYVLYADNSSRGMQFFNWSDGTRLNSGIKPDIGSWEFWTATNNGSEMKIYRNAKLIENISSTTQSSSSKELGIGAAGNNQEFGMTGKIQEARLYNHALTQSEIQYLYNVTKRGQLTTSKKKS